MKVKRVRSNAILPTRANPLDAGLDLYTLEDVEIPNGVKINIPTGIAIAIPEGYVGLIFDRSSIGNKGIRSLAGVIDSSYHGEIQVILANVVGADIIEFKAGDRIAQIIVVKALIEDVEEVDDLDLTGRGTKGFGSSGR